MSPTTDRPRAHTMSFCRRDLILSLGASVTLTAAACGRSNATATQAQNEPVPRPDLYNCEGCEAVGEVPFESLGYSTRLYRPTDEGQRLQVTGRVLTTDGAAASGVVIYAHHTNAGGLYADGTNHSVWSRRHGRFRGWVRTDQDGRYRFETIKPAPYPSETIPAHIHMFVGEPGRPPYYIDDLVFEGEFGVDQAYRAKQEFRGGSGIVRLVQSADGDLAAERDIRLERHPE